MPTGHTDFDNRERKMKITTIYATKILGYITARGNALTTAGEIVENIGISYQYCLKIMWEMKNAGILVSEQGRNGGYKLRPECEEVSLYEIVRLFERRAAENERAGNDPFSRFMKQLYEKEAEDLKKFTIRDIFIDGDAVEGAGAQPGNAERYSMK